MMNPIGKFVIPLLFVFVDVYHAASRFALLDILFIRYDNRCHLDDIIGAIAAVAGHAPACSFSSGEGRSPRRRLGGAEACSRC
jgi:hypothetical protein